MESLETFLNECVNKLLKESVDKVLWKSLEEFSEEVYGRTSEISHAMFSKRIPYEFPVGNLKKTFSSRVFIGWIPGECFFFKWIEFSKESLEEFWKIDCFQNSSRGASRNSNYSHFSIISKTPLHIFQKILKHISWQFLTEILWN